MTCPSCGADVPDAARFCPSCGQSLVARPDERRVATVLFADLVGFTTFSEASDPEQVKNLVDRCFDSLAADITAFGGRVDKIVGDALVALFGAPVAHEDDPERAVRAALALQASMETFCANNEVSVQLRVGVNTGEVLVGGIRAGDDYTAMGDVVNIASRLQTVASPGEVLVGPDTYEATRDAVAYERAGMVEIRGRTQPMTTWVARDVLTRPGRRALRGDAPLVGRDTELALLRESVLSARSRRRALLLLVIGEAGVGKSRLATEIPHPGKTTPATVLVGQCVPYGEANPWAPVADALRQVPGLDADPSQGDASIERTIAEVLEEGPDNPEIARITGGLRSVMGDTDASVDVEPARAREEIVRSVHLVLEALARRDLVVLVLSDLHWADDLVLELMDSLLTRMRDQRFVLLATARPELAERWRPSTQYETSVMHLDPLDDEATTTLIRSHLGPDTPDSVVDLLLERSGGNPFFIEELAALAAESDVKLETLVARQRPEERIRGMPATLRGLVAARLDALDEPTREVLEDCAVAGSVGPLELAASLGKSRGEADVATRLDGLAERGLVTVAKRDYEFKSELVREIAYGTLTKAERARRHAVVAAWIDENGSGDEVERVEQRAMHYGAAAELARELGGLDAVPSDLFQRAVRAHEQAALLAERREVWHHAEHHFDAAIALAGDGDPRHVVRLLGLVRARVERHELEDVLGDLDRATELAHRSSDPALVMSTLLLRGLFENRSGRFDDAVVAYDEAIERARDLGDEQSLASGLRGRGLTLLFRGDLDGAEAAIEPALEIFHRIKDRRGVAWALQNLAWIAFYRGQPTLADDRLQAAIEMFAELHDWGGLDWALGLHAWVRFSQGRLAEAEELAQQVLPDSEDSGDRWATGMMNVLLAQVKLWTGHPTQAIDRSLEAQERFAAIGDEFGILQSLIPRARALACLGRLDEAGAAIDAMAVAATKSAEDAPTLPPILEMSIGGHLGDADWVQPGTQPAATTRPTRGLSAEEQGIAGALVLLHHGEVDEARAKLELSYADASSESATAAAGGLLAMARASAGDGEQALALTDGLVDLQVGSYLDRLQAWMARALAAAQLHRDADALTAADRAVELADATESPLDHAITRLARAVVLERLHRDESGPAHDEARALLDELGVRARGWLTVFRLAAHGADTPATPR